MEARTIRTVLGMYHAGRGVWYDFRQGACNLLFRVLTLQLQSGAPMQAFRSFYWLRLLPLSPAKKKPPAGN